MPRNYFGNFIAKCEMNDMREKADTSTIHGNLEWIWGVRPLLKKEMQEARNHLMNDDYNTLIEWATVDKKEKTSEIGFLGTLTH